MPLQTLLPPSSLLPRPSPVLVAAAVALAVACGRRRCRCCRRRLGRRRATLLPPLTLRTPP
eukprot:4097381-Pyramimonas_sp.AAC.1